MKKVRIPSGSWYGDEGMTLTFPEDWDVQIVSFPDRPALTDDEMLTAFGSPIGTPKISELAAKSKNAVIIVEDLSRPAPVPTILPYILDELKAGGIDRSSVLIVMAIGCHRQLIRPDLIRKLGEDVVKTVDVISSEPDDHLTPLGRTSRGTPMFVNQYVMECDLKIGLGGIYPHAQFAFGGGAKIILPGVTGLETTKHNHKELETGGHVGSLENEQRLDAEEVARKVGLDVVVNAVINSRREAVRLFVGDVVEAQRKGAEFARQAYATPIREGADIVIANAYPLDVSLQHAGKGSWPLKSVKDGGIKIITSAATEGYGYHRLFLKHRSQPTERTFDNSDVVLFSPNLIADEAYRVFPKSTIFFNKWYELMDEIMPRCSAKDTKVAIYPCATIQIPQTDEP
ncbi:lactate racemase domain-containing protein [Candidatus Poribacteria bacterium]